MYEASILLSFMYILRFPLEIFDDMVIDEKWWT